MNVQCIVEAATLQKFVHSKDMCPEALFPAKQSSLGSNRLLKD